MGNFTQFNAEFCHANHVNRLADARVLLELRLTAVMSTIRSICLGKCSVHSKAKYSVFEGF